MSHAGPSQNDISDVVATAVAQALGSFREEANREFAAIRQQAQNELATLNDTMTQRQRVDRDTIRHLEQQVQALSASPRELTPDTTRQPSPNLQPPNILISDVPKRKALPWPDKFEGDRSKFPGWVQQVKDKLRIDGPRIGDNEAQFYGVNRCLGEKPQQVCAVYYAAGGPNKEYNPHLFLDYLAQTYGDPNRALKAANKLRTLKQGAHQSFSVFLPSFEQTLAEANGALWHDSAKLTYLLGAIDEELRRALVPVKLAETYPQWVQQVTEISYKLEACNPRRGGRPFATPPLADLEGDVPMSGINAVPKGRRRPGPPANTPSATV